LDFIRPKRAGRARIAGFQSKASRVLILYDTKSFSANEIAEDRRTFAAPNYCRKTRWRTGEILVEWHALCKSIDMTFVSGLRTQPGDPHDSGTNLANGTRQITALENRAPADVPPE